MSRNDEHTQVRQRLGALGGPEPPDPDAFAPGRPRSGRWDEDSLDDLDDAADFDDGRPNPPSRAWSAEPNGVWHERLVPERLRGTRWDPGHRGVLMLAGVGVTAVLVAGVVSLRDKPIAQPVPPVAAVRTEVVTTTEAGQVGAGDPRSGVAPGQVGAGAGHPGAAPGQVDAGAGHPGAAPGQAGAGAGQPGAGAGAGRAAPSGSSGPAGAAPSGSPSAGGGMGSVPTGINGHAASGELVVSVVGMVDHGGLLRFPTGARVADALTAASPQAEADLSGLNLAQHLSDGDQIVIGKSGGRPGTPQVGSTIVGAAPQSPNTPAPTGSAPPSGTPAGPPGPAKKVDLNAATEAELDALPGVGPVTAKAIVAWRTQHGRFTSIDQLADIDGIGPSRLAKLRGLVTI
ncbi:helix-hairpin-helix domain-containing protein [Nocardia sp. NPDC050406]|uniref:helix-hairpin-helix domain-containing protein n=1 Tax=Nocardia sp. NPDC050406 TaxID=3364318 RepID=UPI003798CCA9